MADFSTAAAKVGAVIEPVSDLLQRGVRAGLGALPQEARDALDGTWLGAPLHAALTDVPIGASAVAAMADGARVLTGEDALDAASDAAVGVAVLAAVPAALTGANDWSYLRGEPKRVGAVHAILNSLALVLNIVSLLARRRGDRGRGRLLSMLGFGVSSLAAHLGGRLSFGLGIRVDRTAFESRPAEFVPVLDEADLPTTGVRGVELDGADVLLARVGGRVCAIGATCTHLGGPLARGERRDDAIVCPWHGSRFDLCSGAVLDGPAVYPQPQYDVRVAAGKIEVRRRDD